jgi:hypothetical protein
LQKSKRRKYEKKIERTRLEAERSKKNRLFASETIAKADKIGKSLLSVVIQYFEDRGVWDEF